MTTHMPALTIPNAIFQNPASSILLPVALGTAVGLTSRPSNTQKIYREIKQPPFRPPPWLFGPVWTCLYGLMGYAAHRVAAVGEACMAPPEVVRASRHSLTLYTIQLGLNLAWMPLFFVARRPVEATADIVCLLATNGYMTYLWSGIDQVAGWCQLPYMAWLSFATYLCVGAGYLNGWDLKPKERDEKGQK